MIIIMMIVNSKKCMFGDFLQLSLLCYDIIRKDNWMGEWCEVVVVLVMVN